MPRVLHVLSQRPSLTGSGITIDALVRHAGKAGWKIGDHLVSIYSPELLAAQQELIEARRRVEATAGEPSKFLADSNRRAPGYGHIDFDAVAAALRQIDYHGWISAEVLPLPDDRAAAEQALGHMRRILGTNIQRST